MNRSIHFFILLILSVGALSAQNVAHRIPIAFYNVENLFDCNDDANDDAEFLPQGKREWTNERYQEKLNNIARVLGSIADNGAAVVGLAEVENRHVLEDLVRNPSIRKRNYSIIHYDSPDPRGIDCALLYDARVFRPKSSGVRFIALPDESPIPTRDILFATGTIENEVFHFIVAHWPSRYGGDPASAGRRMVAAQTMRQVADSLLREYPGSKAILMGDFNDDPFDASVVEGLNLCQTIEETHAADLFSPMLSMYRQGAGTLAYKGEWNLFDIMAVSGNLLKKNTQGLHLYQDPESHQLAYVFRRDYLLQQTPKHRGEPLRTFAGGKYIGGYSDHLPVYLYLTK
jgi:endonuclease/exonuclease/phosphatase family protein|nr:endonuclease/exonuclease/phosphatase family protein [uncultured Porphyromonas sp.]